MVAYERYITVDNPDALVIPGLPLRKGQTVRVTVTVEERDHMADAEALRDLFKRTQAQCGHITEEDIEREIEAVRRQQRP